MTQRLSRSASCCVCGASDERVLVEVALDGGTHATLCGSHALMFRRSATHPSSVAELRGLLRDRRGRRDRRGDGDELGEALAAAFRLDRRGAERRGSRP